MRSFFLYKVFFFLQSKERQNCVDVLGSTDAKSHTHTHFGFRSKTHQLLVVRSKVWEDRGRLLWCCQRANAVQPPYFFQHKQISRTGEQVSTAHTPSSKQCIYINYWTATAIGRKWRCGRAHLTNRTPMQCFFVFFRKVWETCFHFNAVCSFSSACMCLVALIHFSSPCVSFFPYPAKILNAFWSEKLNRLSASV